MQLSAEQIRERFHARKLRCTRQREALYAALAATKQHPTAEELFRLAKCEDESLSLATVYNTLEALQAAGLARKLPVPGGSARFDADTGDHAHVAFSDNRIIDLPDDLGARLLGSLTPEVRREIEERLEISIEGLGIVLHAKAGSGRAEG